MDTPHGTEGRVLVLMPMAQDARRTCALLAEAGFTGTACADLDGLCHEITAGAGAVLLTDEALAGDHCGRLDGALAAQAPWSDVPLVVLTRAGAGERQAALRESANVTLVERPVRMRTLLSVVRAALRDRRRQYAVRDLLDERERAGEALRNERERYRVTLASIGDAVIATDTDGRVTFLNQVAEALTGWEAYVARGRFLDEVFRIVNESTRRPVPNPALRALQQGVVVGLANHTILIARDGTERPLDDSAAPIRGADGAIVGAVLVFRDITEKKQAEAAVRETERRFHTLFESMDEGFCVVEMLFDEAGRPVDYRFLEVNPAFEKQCGLKNATGRTMREFVPDHDAHWFEIFGKVAVTGEAVRFVNEAKALGGRWFNVYAFRLGGPTSRNVAILFTDITSWKQAEAALRFLADASVTLATIVDYQSTLQKVAALAVPHFADWCAVDMAEPGGTLRRLAVAHVDAAKVRLALAMEDRYPARPDGPHGAYHVLRTGKSEMVTDIPDALLVASARDEDHLRLLRELGLKSYMCVPLLARGKTLGIVTFATAESGRPYTVADLAFAEELARRSAIAIENAQLYAELRDADRRKDEFLATLAHELRNPLAPIRTSLQILKTSRIDAETVRRSRDMMERQVHHLVRLVDDLLDVSRVMRGKIELRRERVELATAIARAVETAQPLVDAQGHELRVSLPLDSLPIDADPVRLAQVVGNLVTNAAKYTEANGRIWLTAERDGDAAILRIRDNGIGIAPAMLPRIFEFFVQVDHASTKAQGGLGIGLTLVKNLVEMHNGTVEARSDGLGKGSEFVVRLPIAAPTLDPDDGREIAQQVDQPPSASGHRLLVVDDNQDAADSFATLLRLQGHEVRVAFSGLAALEMTKTYVPDVVFLDIGMPGMDGYEVARKMRQQPRLESVVLAALTGWGQPEDRRRTAEAGFNHHLVKPPEPRAVENVLAELVDESGLKHPRGKQ